jgi:hypothetical protein
MNNDQQQQQTKVRHQGQVSVSDGRMQLNKAEEARCTAEPHNLQLSKESNPFHGLCLLLFLTQQCNHRQSLRIETDNVGTSSPSKLE